MTQNGPDPSEGRGKAIPLEIPWGKLDTRTDAAMLPPGSLTKAENCSVQVGGIKTKRYGYTALSALPTASIPVRAFLRGSELGYVDGPQVRVYNSLLSSWPTRGNMATPEASMVRRQIAHDHLSHLVSASVATANGVTVHAWLNLTTFQVWATAYAEATGAIIVPPTRIMTNAYTTVNVVAVGNLIAVVARQTTFLEIDGSRIDTTSSIMSFSVSAAITADVSGATQAFDVAPFSSTDFLMVRHGAASNQVVATLVTASTWGISATATIAETPSTSAAIMGTPGEKIYVAYCHAGLGLRVSVRNVDLSVAVAPFSAHAAVNVNRIGMVRKDSASIWLTFNRTGSGTYYLDTVVRRDETRWLDITNAGATTVLGLLDNFTMVSNPIMVSGLLYVSALFDSGSGQQSLFLARLSSSGAASDSSPAATLVGMAQYRSGNNVLINSQKANVFVSGSTIAMAASGFTKLLTARSPYAGIERIDWQLGDAKRFSTFGLGSVASFAGSIGSSYDGGSVTEQQFLEYPEGFRCTASNKGSAGLADGTYIYIIIREWIDNYGNAHQSSMSVPVSVVVSGYAGNGQVTVDRIPSGISTLRLYGSISRVKVSIFRNAPSVDVAVFYKIQELTDVAPNGALMSHVDFHTDAAISTGERLYTTGGVLDKECPPPSSQMILHQGAVWGVSSDDPYALFYSSTIETGAAPWFSSGFQVRADIGGVVTGIASLDEKLIVFKDGMIFVVAGNRPNSNGANGQLSLPQLVSSDCGCIDWRSIVVGPAGVYFLSRKGIQLLDRGMNVIYVGAAVEAYTAGLTSCFSAKMLPDRREIRWEVSDVLGGNTKLVYNYEQDEWTTHVNYSGIAAVDAVVGPSTRYTWFSGASALQENSTYFDPGATFVSMTLETGWLHPAGLLGLLRCQYAIALVDRKDPHSLTLQVAKDYAPTYAMSKTWTNAQLVQLGFESPSMNLSQQQGAAFRAKISDASDGTPITGAGFNARALRLMAIAKRGSFEKFMNAAGKQ